MDIEPTFFDSPDTAELTVRSEESPITQLTNQFNWVGIRLMIKENLKNDIAAQNTLATFAVKEVSTDLDDEIKLVTLAKRERKTIGEVTLAEMRPDFIKTGMDSLTEYQAKKLGYDRKLSLRISQLLKAMSKVDQPLVRPLPERKGNRIAARAKVGMIALPMYNPVIASIAQPVMTSNIKRKKEEIKLSTVSTLKLDKLLPRLGLGSRVKTYKYRGRTIVLYNKQELRDILKNDFQVNVAASDSVAKNALKIAKKYGLNNKQITQIKEAFKSGAGDEILDEYLEK